MPMIILSLIMNTIIVFLMFNIIIINFFYYKNFDWDNLLVDSYHNPALLGKILQFWMLFQKQKVN